MTIPALIALLERACSELCPRCAKGHAVQRRGQKWWHEGQAWFEVPCQAGPVRDVIEAVKAGEKAR